MRADGRRADELRPVSIVTGFQEYAEGSALITLGGTRVLCAVSEEARVPGFLRGTGSGWVTAEYSMLPRATHTRSQREVSLGRVGGRTQEIQRLIGRSLRAVLDLNALGERTLTIDCDVLQADGGTRTASITGAYVALVLALRKLERQRSLPGRVLKSAVAATSAGLVGGELMLDLCYSEDCRAAIDCNVVMTDRQDLVEVQATAEGAPFPRETMDRLLNVTGNGIRELLRAQEAALA